MGSPLGIPSHGDADGGAGIIGKARGIEPDLRHRVPWSPAMAGQSGRSTEGKRTIGHRDRCNAASETLSAATADLCRIAAPWTCCSDPSMSRKERHYRLTALVDSAG